MEAHKLDTLQRVEYLEKVAVYLNQCAEALGIDELAEWASVVSEVGADMVSEDPDIADAYLTKNNLSLSDKKRTDFINKLMEKARKRLDNQ